MSFNPEPGSSSVYDNPRQIASYHLRWEQFPLGHRTRSCRSAWTSTVHPIRQHRYNWMHFLPSSSWDNSVRVRTTDIIDCVKFLLLDYSISERIQTKFTNTRKDRALLRSIRWLNALNREFTEDFANDCCKLKELLQVSAHVQPLIQMTWAHCAYGQSSLSWMSTSARTLQQTHLPHWAHVCLTGPVISGLRMEIISPMLPALLTWLFS